MYLSLIKGHLFAEMCVVADEVLVPFFVNIQIFDVKNSVVIRRKTLIMTI